MTSKISKGRRGEDVALEYLKKKGYKFITRNFRWRAGEIDLILKKKKMLIFVEVRSFTSDKMGMEPLETIGPLKIKRLLKTAMFFIETHPEFQDYDLRFDAVGVKFSQNGVKIHHIENAIRKEW